MLITWNWDSVLEKVAGTKLATQLRTHKFRQDVQRAGEAQERRARSAPSSMPTSRVVSPTRSHGHTPPDERDRLIDGPAFVLPPGSMRIRRTPFRQAVHYEVPVAPAELRTPSDHLSVTNSEELCPKCTRSPQDSALPSPSPKSPSSRGSSSYSHTPASASRTSSVDQRKSAVSSFGSALSGQRSDAETVASLLKRRKVRIVLPEQADSAVASDTEDDEDEAEDSEDEVEPEQQARRVMAG
ncbi:hypothetical protein LTR17_005849 [Elasticomyces elasticus]|nr:hypothetical protein LTR17_005849 [Elasticomyces elasticus]